MPPFPPVAYFNTKINSYETKFTKSNVLHAIETSGA